MTVLCLTFWRNHQTDFQNICSPMAHSFNFLWVMYIFMFCCGCGCESSGSEMQAVLHLIIRKYFKFIYDLRTQLFFFSIKENPLVFLKLIGLFVKEIYQGTFQFSRSVVSNSLWPQGLQHARLPCPSPTPGVWSHSCPLNASNHLILCRPLLLLPSIFPSIRVFSSESAFHIRWPIRVSASASVLPMNIQDWFPLGWTGWIFLQFKGLSESSPTPQFKSTNSSELSFLYGPTLTSIHN